MSTTSKFVAAFKPDNEVHVKWLAVMCDLVENWGKFDLEAEMKKNPMNIAIEKKDALDWPHIHFCLCAVYAKAVLKGQAWVPAARTSP
jgi:hypothetical protein